MTTFSKKWVALTILGILGIVADCNAQARISAGVGMASKPFGMAEAGYQVQRAYFSFEVNRNIIQPPSILGVSAGYIVKNVRLYSGLYYKITGHKSSQDRYVHDGVTTVLSSGYETNKLIPGFGFSINFEHIVVDCSWKDGVRFAVMYSLSGF